MYSCPIAVCATSETQESSQTQGVYPGLFYFLQRGPVVYEVQFEDAEAVALALPLQIPSAELHAQATAEQRYGPEVHHPAVRLQQRQDAAHHRGRAQRGRIPDVRRYQAAIRQNGLLDWPNYIANNVL